MERSGERAYFAAVNSGSGFVSFFDEIFYAPSIIRRYIIKGGPGTGKSSFMRRVAKHAQQNGVAVSYYYCSSDTDSLDGVIIDGKIALLDGTAPHSCDTVLAGACDEIINLGDFWNATLLAQQKSEIARYTYLKKCEYACAYSYLGAALRVAEAQTSLVRRFADREKLTRSAQKICVEQRAGTGKVTRMQMSAFGVRGNVRFDTLKNEAKEICAVEDHYGVGALFMSELLHSARARGCDVAVSFDTVSQSVPEEILFLGSGELFYLCRSAVDNERAVRCTRFVDKNALAPLRSACRVSEHSREDILALASDRLAVAGSCHAATERIYIGAMNFDGVREKCNAVIRDTERYY